MQRCGARFSLKSCTYKASPLITEQLDNTISLPFLQGVCVSPGALCAVGGRVCEELYAEA